MNSSHLQGRVWTVHNERIRFHFFAICTKAQDTICRPPHQAANKTALHQALLLLRGFAGPSAEQAHGREDELPLPTTKEADQVVVSVVVPTLKVQCHTCEYFSVQDTRRDPAGAMLEMCREIHQNTYPNHFVEILQLSRDELEFVIASNHPKFRRKTPPENPGPNHRQNRSAIFEIMADLRKLERDDLEDLWRDYGGRD
jgi:hypothetical protein